MKQIKKGLVYTLAGSMLFGNVAPAMAYTYKDSEKSFTTQEVNENATSNTTVYAEVGSAFKVTIPKHIILNGTTKSGAYTVGVEGDIAGTEAVNVVPDKSFALKSNFLADVTANITQDKTSWGYAEMLEGSAVVGNGAIDAKDITAGSWNGNFNFNINLEDKSGQTENPEVPEEPTEPEQKMLSVNIYNFESNENIASYSIKEGSTWRQAAQSSETTGVVIDENNEVTVDGKVIFDPATYKAVKDTDIVKEQTYGETYMILLSGWYGFDEYVNHSINICATSASDWFTICEEDPRFTMVDTSVDDSYFWITDYYDMESKYIIVYNDDIFTNIVIGDLAGWTTLPTNPETKTATSVISSYQYQIMEAPQYDEE